MLSGDALCRVLAFLPRNADSAVRAVCREWKEEVHKFRKTWYMRGAIRTVHPSVSYRLLLDMPSAKRVRPPSPLYEPSSPTYEPRVPRTIPPRTTS
jgi:hypothetical protein